MLYKTRGIVLKTIKYADNNLIAKIYTEQFGLRTYFIRGLSGKTGKARKALLQSLSLINLHVYEKESAEIQQIRDMECAYFFKNIYSDIRKSSILVFLNEVLYKTVIEETANPGLFDFIFQSIVKLDNTQEHIAGFHAVFLIQLTRYLGFFPQNSYSEQCRFFDLLEGSFVKEQPHHSEYFDGEMSRVFSTILAGNETVFYGRTELRSILLQKIIRFYGLHIPSFGELKSITILKQLFDAQRTPSPVD